MESGEYDFNLRSHVFSISWPSQRLHRIGRLVENVELVVEERAEIERVTFLVATVTENAFPRHKSKW